MTALILYLKLNAYIINFGSLIFSTMVDLFLKHSQFSHSPSNFNYVLWIVKSGHNANLDITM